MIAGPYGAALMGDLGADVIKVERPGRGDDLRAGGGDGMSATFAPINRNKRGIAVDLQTPEGARLVFELARRADRNPHFTPAEAFRTTAGWLQIVILNADQYARFCTVLGPAPFATEPAFATNESRLAHHEEFRAGVEAALAEVTTAEWVARLEAAQIAAGPIHEFDEVFEDPQVKHLGLVAEVAQPGYGSAKMLAFPG